MTLDASKVVVGLTGGVYFAVLGTALPADASAALVAAYKEVGYLEESGVVEGQSSSTTKLKAWQNGAVVRILETEHSATLKFTMQESNANSLELFYGNYAAGVVEISGGAREHHVIVVEVMDGDDHVRLVAEDGQLSERGDVSYVNGNAVSYPVTLECFPGADGVKIHKYYETAGTA
jgi:hypothetical protein